MVLDNFFVPLYYTKNTRTDGSNNYTQWVKYYQTFLFPSANYFSFHYDLNNYLKTYFVSTKKPFVLPQMVFEIYNYVLQLLNASFS